MTNAGKITLSLKSLHRGPRGKKKLIPLNFSYFFPCCKVMVFYHKYKAFLLLTRNCSNWWSFWLGIYGEKYFKVQADHKNNLSGHCMFFSTFQVFWHICVLSESFPILKEVSLPRGFCSQLQPSRGRWTQSKNVGIIQNFFFSCFFLWMWAKIPFKIQNSLKTQNAVIHQPIYTHVYSIIFHFTDCCLSSGHKEWSQNTARTFPVQTVREYESLVSSFS